MSDSENGDSLSDINQFRLSMQNSFQFDDGLLREVLEMLTNYSVSSLGWLSDDIRALEDECRDDEALLNESSGSARAAQLQALANRQRSRLDEAELDIAAYNSHLIWPFIVTLGDL